MSDRWSSSNDCAQKQTKAFGQRVKRAVSYEHLNNSIPCDEGTFHNPFCDSRFKKVPVTVIYSQGPHPGEPPDLPVKAQLHSPRSGNQSEIKIVQVCSMAVEKDSKSVDNSHQHSNLLEQVGQIMPADNSSDNDVSQTVQTQESLVHSEAVAIRTNWEGKAHINKYVANSSEKTTDNKATRLEREKERKRERRKDPAYAKRERDRQRERYQDPAYAKRHRERQRELRKDPAYAKREREHKRERRKDPAYAKRERERDRERKRELRKDPTFVKREKERQRERQRQRQKELRKDTAFAERQREFRKGTAYAERKKRYCQSIQLKLR